MKKIAEELLSIAKKLAFNAAEGDWSHKMVRDSKGILGLDTTEHTNDGYKLVRMPSNIFGALVAVGLQKEVIEAHTDGSMWVIRAAAEKFDVRANDLKAWMDAGFYGLRYDGGKMILWFK